MVKALVYGFVAMFFYAAQNVLIDHKLTKVPPLVILAIASGTIFTLSIITLLVMHRSGVVIEKPPKELMAFIVLAGALIFLAEWSYFSAYAEGIPLVVVTTLPVFIPMFATGMRCAVLNGDKPTPGFYAGVVTAFVTLWLMMPKK